MEQLQSHIHTYDLRVSSYMAKYLGISSYITLQLLHFLNFLIHEKNLIFFFISVERCNMLSWVNPSVMTHESTVQCK
jgi:hypothetical protein